MDGGGGGGGRGLGGMEGRGSERGRGRGEGPQALESCTLWLPALDTLATVGLCFHVGAAVLVTIRQ